MRIKDHRMRLSFLPEQLVRSSQQLVLMDTKKVLGLASVSACHHYSRASTSARPCMRAGTMMSFRSIRKTDQSDNDSYKYHGRTQRICAIVIKPVAVSC